MFKDKMFYISSSAIAVVIIIGILAFSIFNNKANNGEISLGESVEQPQQTEEASTSMEEPLKEADEVVEIKKEEPKKIVSDQEPKNVEEQKQTVPVVQELPDPTFIKPVEGEILKEYAKDKLVYSTTLKEWVTHLGIDIKADKTTVIKASAEGTIQSIKNDPRYGLSVVIEHVNGYVTVYSNLLTAEFVVVGEKVQQGQTIGTIGNTASFEILDEPHLHFEIQKDGQSIDPNMYL